MGLELLFPLLHYFITPKLQYSLYLMPALLELATNAGHSEHRFLVLHLPLIHNPDDDIFDVD